MVTSFVFALFATFGFCILFHVPLRCMLPAAAIGGIGWFAYQLLMELGLGITASAFLASCLVALLAFVFAFKTKAVVCSSARFGIYEKIPFLFCFL